MKIALISFLLDEGGGSVAVARRLARQLASRGEEVVAITTHRRGPLRTERRDGVDIYRFRPRNLYWVAEKDRQPTWKRVTWQLIDSWNPHVYRVVRKILERERPDLVHVHKLRGLSPAVWTAARSAGVEALVQTCHDYELLSPEGTLDSRVGRMAESGSPFLLPYRAMRARCSRAVTAVSAPSRHTLETAMQGGFFPRARSLVIPNSHGFDGAALRRLETAAESRGAADRVEILYLGRLVPNKGVEVLCEAFVRAERRAPRLRLSIAGDGPQAAFLRQRFAGHEKIRFCGNVGGEEKHRLLAETDLMVVPSTWREVFGIVIAEAFAYGKPVLASDIGAIPELVEPERTGELFPPGDVEALAELLAGVGGQPDEVRNRAAACFAEARKYTEERVTDGYLSLYREQVGHG